MLFLCVKSGVAGVALIAEIQAFWHNLCEIFGLLVVTYTPAAGSWFIFDFSGLIFVWRVKAVFFASKNLGQGVSLGGEFYAGKWVHSLRFLGFSGHFCGLLGFKFAVAGLIVFY